MKRDVFTSQATVRKDVLKHLEKDAIKHTGDDREILLSFTSDPYQPLEEEENITRRAIEILISNDLQFTLLTKGGTRATRDFDLLKNYDKCSFGTTLVFTKQPDADKWEIYCANIADRINAITTAKENGIRTWISLEPVIFHDQAIDIINELHSVVDHWKVGKLNYHLPGIPVNWVKFREEVTALLDSVGADYYIKKSLTQIT